MNGLPISPVVSAAKGPRRRRESLSTGRSFYEAALVILLLASVLGSIVLFGTVRAWSASIVLFMVSLCAIGYVLHPCFHKSLRAFSMPPGLGWLLLFFVYALFRVCAADVKYEAVLDVVKIGGFALAYVVWAGLGGRFGRWRWVFGILIFTVTLICWYALIQHVHGTSRVLMLMRPAGYGMRASGTHMCPNHFANLLGMVSCVCVGLLLMPEAGVVLRILSLYSILLLVPVNYLTQSRSGWIGMAAGILCTLLLGLWRRSRKGFFIVLVALPILLTAAGAVLWTKSDIVRERISGMDVGSPDGSVRFRFNIWRETMVMIREAPLWGHGGGVFRWIHPHYKTTGLQELWAIYPHNEYLHITSEYGGAGVLLIALAVCAFLWKMLKTAFVSDRDRDAVMASLVLGVLGTSLIHACFDFNFHIYANNMTLALIAGVAVSSMDKPADRQNEKRFARWGWILYYGAILLIGLFVLVQSIRIGLSYWYAWNGERQSLLFHDEAAKQRFDRALRWMPDYWIPLLKKADIYQGRCMWERDPEEKKILAGQALALYSQARLLNPYDSEIQNGESQLYGVLGDRDNAMKCLREVLDYAPNEVFFLNQMGIQLRLAGRTDEAKPFFERAQRLSPNDVSALNIQLILRAEADAGR